MQKNPSRSSPARSKSIRTVALVIGGLTATAVMLAAVVFGQAGLVPGTIASSGTSSLGEAGSASGGRHFVSIIGDSYTEGTFLGGLDEKNWTALVSKKLLAAGYDHQLSVSGIGGIGYRDSAVTSFPLEVSKVVHPQTDVVVFLGSRNDVGTHPLQVKANAAKSYSAAQQIAPAARLLVIGVPWTSELVPGAAMATNAAVAQAAAEAGATFVDPQQEGWFFGPDAAFIGADQVHPTDDGHAYMAEKITPHLLATLTQH